MNGIKKFITLNVPVGACNFRCPYCYISQCDKNAYSHGITPFVAEPKRIARFFSKERMGGECYFNLCASGETSFHPKIAELIQCLLHEGHVADIITNGTNTAFFQKIIPMLNENERKRFFVKFSFHYLELVKKNLLETFVKNVNLVKNSGISYSVEITPHDELVPFIDEIKKFSMENFKALPHITVARNQGEKKIGLLTKYSREEYKRIWESFDSALFDFKISIFSRKRKEFCYAGLWSLSGSLETGDLYQCYIGNKLGNILDCTEKDFEFKPVCRCREPHCFNGHAFLTLGNCPELASPSYAEMRDRVCTDGTNFLSDELREFFGTKLFMRNEILMEEQKKFYMVVSAKDRLVGFAKRAVIFPFKVAKKIKGKIKKLLGGGGIQ